MRQHLRKNNISGLLALLLFAIFAVCVLSVLLMSADSYQRLTARDQASYNQRTAAQYLTTRIRQADAAGTISVRVFGGTDALIFTEEFDGVLYETRVYCYEGYIRELFIEADADFEPELGEKILPANVLRIYDEGSYLQMELKLPDHANQTLILHLRSGEEASL